MSEDSSGGSPGTIMTPPGTRFGATETRKRRLLLLFVLSAVFAISIAIGYYAAGFRPTGRGVGNAPYLFFDHLPWLPFTAAFFALILASRMRRVACYIDRENQRVLRMDFAARLGHWLTALPCMMQVRAVHWMQRLMTLGNANQRAGEDRCPKC